MQSKIIHKCNMLALATFFALGCTLSAGSAWAQDQSSSPSPTANPTPNDYDINRTELNNFDKYLDDHPNVRRQLKENPSLINDPNFLGQHPGLQTFLKNHPGVQEEVKENPTRFVNREGQFERRGGDFSRAEARKGDQFLDSHPEIAQRLRKNPGLIDNKEFVQNHPELGEFLKNHPEVRQDWKEHPRAFEKRQRQFERHERGEGRRRRK